MPNIPHITLLSLCVSRRLALLHPSPSPSPRPLPLRLSIPPSLHLSIPPSSLQLHLHLSPLLSIASPSTVKLLASPRLPLPHPRCSPYQLNNLHPRIHKKKCRRPDACTLSLPAAVAAAVAVAAAQLPLFDNSDPARQSSPVEWPALLRLARRLHTIQPSSSLLDPPPAKR